MSWGQRRARMGSSGDRGDDSWHVRMSTGSLFQFSPESRVLTLRLSFEGEPTSGDRLKQDEALNAIGGRELNGEPPAYISADPIETLGPSATDRGERHDNGVSLRIPIGVPTRRGVELARGVPSLNNSPARDDVR
mmetsp:Transcript_6392/g.14735  ORF Transcript_6392/g.14735 Transcript_6392/m.14735 type:complete len:135 (-) Transcript_6392:1401-1805(-)